MKNFSVQFSRFFVVGGLSAIVQFTILISLIKLFGVKPIWASTFGYIGGALVNYSLNHYFTFKSSLSHRRAIVRFSANSLFGILANYVMMYFFLDVYSYLLSQILVAAIILVWNFIVHRYWTFQDRKSRRNSI